MQRRALSSLLVLAMLGTFLVVLPGAVPPAAAVTTRPAPSDPLPPCSEDAGQQKGACTPAGSAVGITAGGVFGSDGATVEVRLSPGVAICDSWPGRSVWNPSPCWAGASISVGAPVHLNEAGDDLVRSGSIHTAAGGGSSQILQESLRASTWDASTTVASRCGATRSNFGTYIYGGHQIDAPWRSIGHHALQCTLTWDGDRPDDLKGSTWIPITGSLSVRTNGAAYGSPTTATTWVRVDGDMQNPGPDAAFDSEPAPGGVRLVNESTHPWDLGMTYEWDLPDGTSTETSPVVDLGPGLHFVRLTATDTDGLVDSVWRWVEVSSDELAVTITRAEDGPVEVGEEFDVVLTVAAPPENSGDVTGVQPVGSVLELPAWLERIDGTMPTGFDLTPGSQRSATLRLRATGAGTDTVSSSWTGTDETGGAVGGASDLPITALGTIGGEWFRTDGLGDDVREGQTAPVRLRVDNETGAPLTDLELTARSVAGVGDVPGTATLTGASGTADGRDEVRSLPTALDASGPGSVGFVDFDLEGVEAGDVRLSATVQGRDPSGDTVTGTITADWTVRTTDLTVELEFDPPEQTQEESEDPEAPPEPVEMTATITVTNTSGGEVRDIRIEEFELSRAIGEQQLWVEQVGGLRLTNWDAPGILLEEPTGTDDPPEPFDLEDGEDKVFTADFIARDDGQLDFHVLALGADDADATVRGFGEGSWVLAPEKYLEVTTEVIIPQDGELLKAGEDIVVKGRVENLSQTAELELGPLLPVPQGNTGLMSLAYGGGRAPDPEELNPIPTLTLGPGDSELFELAVQTNYSDPRIRFEDGEPVSEPSGGTRATLEFAPWAVATEADGTVRTVRVDPQGEEDRGVKLAEEHSELTISIDDSIPIPPADKVLLAGAITKGTLVGVKNAAVGALYGIVDAVKLPYTILRGSYEYQSQVWDSFTEEEKALFAEETSFLIVSILKRNVELGLQDSEELLDQVNQTVHQEMTNLATEWETGDYLSTAEVYAAGAGEAIGSVALPVAMTKLAQTPRAAAAITRAQAAVNARMVPIFDAARGIQYVEDALPLLRALENGAELSADAMRALAGITPEELAELQRLAKKYDVLLTFRSRHQSSIQWIRKFGAMMKPEAIKVKSVSELDVRLGYREGDLGSVVFKKPEPLKRLPDGASGDALEQATRAFVQERGFTPGTAEYDDALKRMKKRIEEWDEYGPTYRTADRRGWIETEFNYEGNAIPGQRPDKFPKDRTGFQLEETGRGDEWVIKLQDPKDGRFKRVTGDIDPIAFTNLDGSPLSPAQHKELMDAMRESAVLRAQHPESATFVDGAKYKGTQAKFILSQFKPDEPGFQIGPNGPARVVRLDPDRSRWKDPRDYHLHWAGGYVHVGGRQKIIPRAADRPDFGRDTSVRVPDKIKPKPMNLGAEGEVTFGRCKVTVTNSQTAPAIFLDEVGAVVEASADGSVGPSEAGQQCLLEGPPLTLETAPTAVVEGTVTGVDGAGPVLGAFGATQGLTLAAAVDADADGAVLAAGQGHPSMIETGQLVWVGTPERGGQVAQVTEVDGSQVLFDRAVDVAVDDVLAVVGLPGDALAGSDQPLPATGADSDETLRLALGMLLLGAVLLQAGRLRREELLHARVPAGARRRRGAD